MIIRTLTALFILISTSVFAANIPAGINLAKEQVLNVGLGAEAPTLDPQKIQDLYSSRVANDLFEPLYTFNEIGEEIPGVADSYKISADNLTYTFHIRDNAKFSDGTPITANDVVFSLRRIVDPQVASA